MSAWKFKLKKLTQLHKMAFQGMRVHFLINKKEMPEMAAYQITLPKNLRIPPSYHKVAHEVIFILHGKGTAHLNKENFSVKKGDVILVQPGTWHSFSTKNHAMKALAITSPYVDSTTDLYH